MEVWEEFLHPTEFLVDLDHTSDVPGIPPLVNYQGKSSVQHDIEFVMAVGKTGRAVALGIALASIDGPLPIMDVAGFVVATALSLRAWHEYFS